MSEEFEGLKQKADAVFDRAMEKTDGMIVLDGLRPLEVNVVLVYHVLGLAGGMGLDEMLDDEMDADPGYVRTINAFREIGASKMAEILEEGIARKTSIAIGVGTSKLQSFDALDEKFYALERDCVMRLGKYAGTSS